MRSAGKKSLETSLPVPSDSRSFDCVVVRCANDHFAQDDQFWGLLGTTGGGASGEDCGAYIIRGKEFADKNVQSGQHSSSLLDPTFRKARNVGHPRSCDDGNQTIKRKARSGSEGASGLSLGVRGQTTGSESR